MRLKDDRSGLKVGVSCGGLMTALPDSRRRCRSGWFTQDVVQRLTNCLPSREPYGCRPLQFFVVGLRDALPLSLLRIQRAIAGVPDPIHDVHADSFLDRRNIDAPDLRISASRASEWEGRRYEGGAPVESKGSSWQRKPVASAGSLSWPGTSGSQC